MTATLTKTTPTGTIGIGTIINRQVRTDNPWKYADCFILCPDSTKISHQFTVHWGEELPSRGDEVRVKKTDLGWVVCQ